VVIVFSLALAMYVEDTIVAPATPAGTGAVAIIRLSGPEAAGILKTVWRSLTDGALEPRRLHLGDVIDPETHTHIDRAMAVFFPKPHSLTGEDVVELQCHGGSYLVRRITSLAMRLGARMAEPGEFTRRAFLNGRIDLTEAEAVADLVEARSESALKQAISHLTGALAERLGGLRRELISIRAHLEAEIDFSDEGISLPSRSEIASSIERLSNDVTILHESYARGRLTREGARAVIIGKPNVGKSSIMNLLLGTDRAIVTAIPGTTRDVIEDSIQVGAYPLVLQDTAGIRESRDEIEKIGIERSRRSLQDADLVLAVFDASQLLTEEDAAIAHHTLGRAGVALLNKNDLPAKAQPPDLCAIGIELPILSFSALRADGIEDLKCELLRALESLRGPNQGEEVTISRERHRGALARALDALAAAKQSALQSMPPEIIAVDVNLAADALGQITGEVHTEDVLDAVFREFCIGK
jgi:tRNA modification GTPase